MHAPYDRRFVSRRRRSDSLTRKSVENKIINPVTSREVIGVMGRDDRSDWLECPMVAFADFGRFGQFIGRIFRPLINPFANGSDFGIAQFVTLRRHLRCSFGACHRLEYKAFCSLTRNNRRTRITTIEHPFGRINAQPDLLLLNSMTRSTMPGQYRFDLSYVVRGHVVSRRPRGGEQQQQNTKTSSDGHRQRLTTPYNKNRKPLMSIASKAAEVNSATSRTRE